jgi:hypothetical protein
VGFLLTKEQWLNRYASGELVYTSFGLEDVQVRQYGTAAVATGVQAQEGTVKANPVDGRFRFTLVYVQDAGRWVLVCPSDARAPLRRGASR